MKAHKHKDVIIAWANGAKIQTRTAHNVPWFNLSSPAFNPEQEYRVKPREFKEGAWYPVISSMRNKFILKYNGNLFEDNNSEVEVRHAIWIGEALEIEWPDNG